MKQPLCASNSMEVDCNIRVGGLGSFDRFKGFRGDGKSSMFCAEMKFRHQ